MLWDWRPSRKDCAFSWVVAAASFLSLFLSLGLSHGTIGVMTVAIGARFSDSRKDELAWIGATRMCFMFCTGVCWSALVNKVGSRLVQIAGSVVLTAAVGVSTLASEVWHLYVTYGALTGVGLSLVFTASSVAVDGHFDRFVHVALPLSQLGGTVGYCVFPAATRRLLDAVGFETSLYAFCGLAILPGLLALTYTGGVRPTQTAAPARTAQGSGELESPALDRSSSAMALVTTAAAGEDGLQKDADLPGSPASDNVKGTFREASPSEPAAKARLFESDSATAEKIEKTQWQRIRDLLAVGGTWLELANFFGTQYTSSSIFVLLPSIVADAGRISVDDAAVGVTIFGAANVAGHLVTTFAALRTYNRLLLFVVACVLFGCTTTAFVAAATSVSALYPLCAFGGFWFGIVLGLLMSVIHHFSGAGRLTDMFGLSTLAAGLGGLAGPGVTGVIQAGAGNAAGVYVSGAFAILAGAALVPAAVQKQRELSGAASKASAEPNP